MAEEFAVINEFGNVSKYGKLAVKEEKLTQEEIGGVFGEFLPLEVYKICCEDFKGINPLSQCREKINQWIDKRQN